MVSEYGPRVLILNLLYVTQLLIGLTVWCSQSEFALRSHFSDIKTRNVIKNGRRILCHIHICARKIKALISLKSFIKIWLKENYEYENEHCGKFGNKRRRKHTWLSLKQLRCLFLSQIFH